MSSQSQGASLYSSADPPMKRKRGRPRKDESVQGDNTPLTPASDNLKKNKQSVGTSDPTSDDMVGQMVSGVIEGSFDAGYLLNVKVGDTNTHLRGVVFLPGRFTPITAANDVAPHAKMYKRKEIPIPFVNPQGHLQDVSPPSGKSEKPDEQKNDAPKLPDQGLHIGLQPGSTTASESQSASIPIPPASNLPINDTGLLLGQKVLQEQFLDSGLQNDKAVGQNQSLLGFEAFKLMKGPNINVEAPKASETVSTTFSAILPPTASESQSASIPIPPASNLPINDTGLLLGQKVLQEQILDSGLQNDKAVGQNQSVLGFEAFKLMKGPNINVEAPKTSETVSTTFSAILPATETLNLNPQVEHQAMSSDLKPQEFFHDDVKSLDLGNNQTPKFSQPEPQAMAFEPAGINIFNKQVSSRQEIDISQDTHLELAKKIMSGTDTSYMDVLSASNSVTTTVTVPRSAPMTSLPIMIFGAETIPSEPKPAAEESVHPRMVVPEVSSSLMASNTNNGMESNAKDAIPSAQS